jgi:hypothetical protein
MAVNEDQTEPIVAVEVSTPHQVRPLPYKADVNWQSDEEDTYEDAKPTEKSGVIRDRNAPAVGFHLSPLRPFYAYVYQSDPTFSKGESVRISEMVGSTRVRGSYQIHKLRWSKSKGHNEYQLIEPLSQVLYNNGAWIRERDIGRDRR